jgi:hypothetical protein
MLRGRESVPTICGKDLENGMDCNKIIAHISNQFIL